MKPTGRQPCLPTFLLATCCAVVACTAGNEQFDAGNDPGVHDLPGDGTANPHDVVVADLPLDQDGMVGMETEDGPNDRHCRPCEADEDCVDPYLCLPVGASKHCLLPCKTIRDCPASFVCFGGAPEGPVCLPETYTCPACVFDEPCEDGKCCDFGTGECKDCLGLCDVCMYDFDCGEGLRCFKKAGSATGACVEECADKPCTDTTNFTCGTNASGVRVCQPNGSGCGGCPEGLYPLPDGTGCVQCVNSSHCETDGICNLVTHECADTDGCHPRCDDGECHMCCEDAHCANVPGSTGLCVDYLCAPLPSCGGACAGGFPVCVTILGIEQCVQCVEDADCAARDPACTCTSAPLYSCVDGDGNPCPFPEAMEGERR